MKKKILTHIFALAAVVLVVLPMIQLAAPRPTEAVYGDWGYGCGTWDPDAACAPYGYHFEQYYDPYFSVMCPACNAPTTCADLGQSGTYPNCYTAQPTCQSLGYDTGTYPNCRMWTCQDYGYQYGTVGNCYNDPPPPTCQSLGYDTGTYPYCRNWTCQDYGYQYGTPGNCYNQAPPTCADYGQLGNYPYCYNAPTCADSGQLGNYPYCYNAPTCADSGQLGNYPYCYTPPTCVSYQYSSCAPSNSCGQVNYGTYACDGSCSVSAPPESSCPVTPAYASLSASPGTVSSGGAATLSYSCSNSYYAELYPSVGSVSPVAGGSRTVYPTTATNYTLYCYANSGGTVTASTIVEVASPLPNLTAGSVSPTSAIAGTAFQVSATISNNGNGSTGGAFPNMFQFSDDAMISTGFMNTLEAYGSQSISANRTFSSAGSYTVRACADTNTVWAGSIAESNEGDNCGAWTTITVTAPTPPSVSCTVDNSNPTAGQTVQYTATPAAGASAPYTWNSSSGGSYGSGSTASRTFATTGVYDMQVRGYSPASGSYGVTAYATCPFVTVGAAPCNNGGVADIRASQTRVRSGSSVTLTWTATDSTAACTVSGPGVSQSSTPAACSVSGSATTPAITTQSTYTISCPGNVSDSIIVNVLPKIEEF